MMEGGRCQHFVFPRELLKAMLILHVGPVHAAHLDVLELSLC